MARSEGLWLRNSTHPNGVFLGDFQFPLQGGGLTWSPNGQYFSNYVLDQDEIPQLEIRSGLSGQVIGRTTLGACSNVCAPPEWSPDSSRVFFVRGPPTDPAGNRAEFQLWEELRGYRSNPQGLTRLSTASSAGGSHNNLGTDANSEIRLQTWRIEYLGVAGGAVRTVASGSRPLSRLLVGSNNTIVAVVGDLIGDSGLASPERTWSFSFYAVPSGEGVAVGQNELPEGSPLIDGAGMPLRRIAGAARMRFGRSASLSPGGNMIAYSSMMDGDPSSGDIYVVDIRTGATRNVSTSVDFGGEGSAAPAEEARDWRRHGKFGMRMLGPLWLDDRHLLVIHMLRLQREDVPIQFRPYRLSIEGDRSIAVPILAPHESLENFSRCANLQMCLAQRTLFAEVRDLISNRVQLVGLNVDTGQRQAFWDLPEVDLGADELSFEVYATRLMFAATASPVAIGLHETASSAPELVQLEANVRGHAMPRRLALLNPTARTPSVRMTRVSWRDGNGYPRSGLLITPAEVASVARVPVVVWLYWGHRIARRSAQNFEWYHRLWSPILQGGRFGLFIPEIPTGPGAGGTCRAVTQAVEQGLEAAASTGLVDMQRAGLFGDSYGGWIASCVATHSRRFRAAVAVSGATDLLSACSRYANGQPCDRSVNVFMMRGTPWEYPEDYVAESPIYHVSDSVPPMLLIYGKEEPMGFREGMIQMYSSIASAGGTAELVGYDGRDHGTTLTHPDFWPRVLAWYERHLLNDANPEQGRAAAAH